MSPLPVRAPSVAIRQPGFGQLLQIAIVVDAAERVPVVETGVHVSEGVVQTRGVPRGHRCDMRAGHCASATEATQGSDPAANMPNPQTADMTEAAATKAAADVPDATANVAHAAAADVAHAPSTEVASATAVASTTTAAARQRGGRRSGDATRDHRDRRQHNLAHHHSPVSSVHAAGLHSGESSEPSLSHASKVRQRMGDRSACTGYLRAISAIYLGLRQLRCAEAQIASRHKDRFPPLTKIGGPTAKFAGNGQAGATAVKRGRFASTTCGSSLMKRTMNRPDDRSARHAEQKVTPWISIRAVPS
jgi:hypothetical protein